jgi:hypothetical protein
MVPNILSLAESTFFPTLGLIKVYPQNQHSIYAADSWRCYAKSGCVEEIGELEASKQVSY